MGYHMNDMFPSKWLKAEDFGPGEERTVTIDQVKQQEMGEGAKAELKFVLSFHEDKPLVLNKTNANIISKLYGPDTDDWVARPITLFTAEVDAFGDIVRSIRVRSTVPRAVAPPVGRSAPSAPVPDPFDDNGEDEGSAPATGLQIAKIKEAAVKLWGDEWRTEIGKETGGRHPSSKVAGVILDRINEAIRKRDAVARPVVNLSDPFDDDFDDSDPFSDE